MSKPYSQACENNKAFILRVIENFFNPGEQILEIGSNTGQHVIFFAEQLNQTWWLPSDTEESMDTLLAGLEDVQLTNLGEPLVLNVQQAMWPVTSIDGIFSANCLHIMSFEAVQNFFSGAGKALKAGGKLCIYGPFKYDGEYTSLSNAKFDEWLKQRDSNSGIRDFEAVNLLARHAGLELIEDNLLPANNQLLVWEKSSPS